ncbi:MAG: hypothetical protein FWF50_03065 [Defluviitaleaceae bacterium]|nr:hypothetical protein [Defluviitaleaceae bacterium]
MQWYYIVMFTVVGVHVFNFFVAIILETLKKGKEENLLMLSTFTIAFPLWVLLYPVRAYKNKRRFKSPRTITSTYPFKKKIKKG